MAELNKKDVQNNKEEVPFAHYEARFRELDPEEAAQRCGVKFENGAFTVTRWETNTSSRGRSIPSPPTIPEPSRAKISPRRRFCFAIFSRVRRQGRG